LGSEKFRSNKAPEEENAEPFTPVLIGGYPRSGRTSVLHELQALGYEIFDDAGLEEIIRFFSKSRCFSRRAKIAVVMGNENGEAPGGLDDFFGKPEARQFPFKLVFIEAGDAVLIDRRPADSNTSPEEASEKLQNSRKSFELIRSKADLILNSSYMLPRDEAYRIEALVEGRPYQVETVVEIMSFGFQYGGEAGDLVLDVRFLPNPYYVNALRPLTGRDEPCAAYVLGFEDAQRTLHLLGELMETMVHAFRKQGRKILKICIGCTGGQHRSVALAEALAKKIKSSGCPIKIRHREMEAHRY
jgi:UPF0042 nucleotide-binding protein